MNICEHLTNSAKLFPDKTAVVFEAHQYSYADISQLASSAAGILSEAGIGRGDRVAIMFPNVPAFVVWYYAALRIGAVAVSVNTRLAPSEVGFILSDCEARAFVSTEELLASARSDFPACIQQSLSVSDLGNQVDGQPLASKSSAADWIETEPDEPALILYTSGTTGFPKGATLSHKNVRSNVHAFNHLCRMRPDDRILLAVPLFHCFGQNALLNSGFNVGATMVLTSI